MKNYAAGRWKVRGNWPGLFLVGGILLPLSLPASYDRRLWVIEQIGYPSLPPLIEEMHNQATLHTTNYSEAISTQISGLLDLSTVEIGAKVSSRLYPSLSSDGLDYKALNKDRRITATLEIARSYVSRNKHYGRLGLELVEFMPMPWRFLRFGFSTGVNATENFYLRANISLFKKLSRESNDRDIFFSALEFGRVIADSKKEWRLGGAFSWTYRTREMSDESPANASKFIGYYEHMLFTIGPFAEYTNHTFYARAFLNCRIWLDKEIFNGPSINDPNMFTTRVVYPTVISYPDAGLALSLVL